jgi:hypothetical protein
MKRPLYYANEQRFQARLIGNRDAKTVIDEVISAFECTAPDDGCIYLSSEITTGKRYYDLLRRHGARSAEELRQRLGSDFERAWEQLKRENLVEGHTFFDLMHSQGYTCLINPGPFFAEGWHQEHYLYLWEWIIVHKCRESRFNIGWNYSNGCTLEYAISLRKGIPRLYPDGRALECSDAIRQIEYALSDLEASGIRPSILRENLNRIIDAASIFTR